MLPAGQHVVSHVSVAVVHVAVFAWLVAFNGQKQERRVDNLNAFVLLILLLLLQVPVVDYTSADTLLGAPPPPK